MTFSVKMENQYLEMVAKSNIKTYKRLFCFNSQLCFLQKYLYSLKYLKKKNVNIEFLNPDFAADFKSFESVPKQIVRFSSEPVFLNVYGGQESSPRNEFRQPM